MAFTVLLDEIKTKITKILIEIDAPPKIDFAVEPAKTDLCDVACNVSFLLARHLRKSPQQIAQMITAKYTIDSPTDLVLSVKAHASGYINFMANHRVLNQIIIQKATEYTNDQSIVDVGHGTSIAIEHTSVNPNKALHIGHVRNIVIGDTMSKILRKANYNVTVLNYIDDSGLQVADIVLGFKKLGFSQEPPNNTKFDQYCGDQVYVQTTKKYKDDPKLEQERKQILQDIEKGESEIARFAESVTKRVLQEQLKTCWSLGVSYDCLNYESQIVRSGLWKNIFEKLKKMNLIWYEKEGKNAGCWVIKSGVKGKRGGTTSDAVDQSIAKYQKQENVVGEGNTKEQSKKEEGGGGGGKEEEDKVIVRSNGTATYIAKDIPYAAWKLGLVEDPFYYTEYSGKHKQPDSKTLWSTTLQNTGTKMNFAAEQVITVIDSRQSNLQKIITELMNKFKADSKKCGDIKEEKMAAAATTSAYIHLGYESVTLSADTALKMGIKLDKKGGKQAQMSGRKGVYVNADTVYDTMMQKAENEIKKRAALNSKDNNNNKTSIEASQIAKDICVGTLRYEMIKQDLDKMINFDLDTSLKIEGDTASYIQYTHARAVRILEKYAQSPNFDDARYELLQSKYETALIKHIGLFENAITESARNFSPKVVARYCHTLATIFNTFYEHIKVLDSDDSDLVNARICLVSSFKITVSNALSLLGIAAPSKM